MPDNLSARVRFRQVFLATSWLGPVTGLVLLSQILKMLPSEVEFSISFKSSVVYAIAALLFLALWIAPFAVMRGETMSEFREIHAFSVASFLTMLLVVLLKGAESPMLLIGLTVFITLFFGLRRLYVLIEEGH